MNFIAHRTKSWFRMFTAFAFKLGSYANWIAWNRNVLMFKLRTCAKLNCLKWHCFCMLKWFVWNRTVFYIEIELFLTLKLHIYTCYVCNNRRYFSPLVVAIYSALLSVVHRPELNYSTCCNGFMLFNNLWVDLLISLKFLTFIIYERNWLIYWSVSMFCLY